MRMSEGEVVHKDFLKKKKKNTREQRKFNTTVEIQERGLLFPMTWQRLEKLSKFRMPKDAE